MAKLNLPLLSAQAKGSFAKALTFAKNKAANYVKLYSEPTDRNTAKQSAQRKRFSICQIVWASLTQSGKNLWGKWRMPQPWCKTNAFLKLNLKTGFPCRETPELPGVPYNRKAEWIVGLAKIGVTPMGITNMWKFGWQ